ncbi:hypothetical protein BLOT_010943 [Blomia tropicalis]|nr:hypothetical protein BLOT_010943 [Blomia tropicalis]
MAIQCPDAVAVVVADLFGTELHSGCIAATPDVIFELDMIFELNTCIQIPEKRLHIRIIVDFI